MDQPTVEVIRKKLDYLDRTLDELDPYLQAGYAKYSRQREYQRITERLVQIIVQAAGDANDLILQATGQRPAGSMRESFAAIRDLGIIDDALFERFSRNYIGLRNRIVHDYDTLDNRILFHSAKRLREDAQKYLKAVLHHVA